jgi:seryl-tRNA synthetase
VIAEHNAQAFGQVKEENDSLRGSCKAMGVDMGKLTRERNNFRAERDKLRAEVEALRGQVETLTEWYANALNVIEECVAALPGVTYMDPPDGGDVSVPEQLRRMAKDAERYRHMRGNATFRDMNGPGLYWYLPRFMRGDEAERLDQAIDEAIEREKVNG